MSTTRGMTAAEFESLSPKDRGYVVDRDGWEIDPKD